MADGCIKKDKIIEIRLSIKDEELLRRIGLWLNYKGVYGKAVHRAPNNKEYETLTMSFTSTILVNELKKCGVSARKTGFEEYKNIPDEYFIYFFKGFMDGDGNISQGSIRLYSRGPILKQILYDTERLYDIKGTEYLRKDVKGIGFKIKDSKILADLMYKEGFCLERKKVILC
jgi:hypothetical protein